MNTVQKKAPQRVLPEGIIPSDLKYPTNETPIRHLSFYLHKEFGWCINTVVIRDERASSYAITMEGKTVIIKLGRQIQDNFMLRIKAKRNAALKKYVDLHAKGCKDARLCGRPLMKHAAASK